MNFADIKKQKGFTLIEMLVVVIIIGLLSTVIIADYQSNSKGLSLERASQRLAQDMRRGEQLAMGTAQGDSQTKGYGLYFSSVNSNTYIIYKNNADNALYDASDPVQESITMEDGIKICSLLVNGANVGGPLTVSFAPPDPTTYINGLSYGNIASIVLCLDDNESETERVTVNNSGMIDIIRP